MSDHNGAVPQILKEDGMKYSLRIFSPGSFVDVLCCLESKHPFAAFNRGDLISTMTLPSRCTESLKSQEMAYGVVLRVVGIEHFLLVEETVQPGGLEPVT